MSTFKERLKILMNGEKPYAWTQKVGIEKGLFQYYWQKERVPSHKNLLKIQRYTGCSLDWLVSGKSVDTSQLGYDEIMIKKTFTGKHRTLWTKRSKDFIIMAEKLRHVYAEADQSDIEALEYLVNAIHSR